MSPHGMGASACREKHYFTLLTYGVLLHREMRSPNRAIVFWCAIVAFGGVRCAALRCDAMRLFGGCD